MKNTSVQGVIDAFIKGEEAKTANGSLASINEGDKTLLVGYSHAVYAERWNGQYYFNAGWYGYSKTTSRHYNLARYLCARDAGPQGVCMQCEEKPDLNMPGRLN